MIKNATTRRLRIAAALVIVPTVLLAGLVLKHELALEKAQTWRVKIAGYDPRDMLKGHYLSFEFDWVWKDKTHPFCKNDEECCFCFESKGTKTAGIPPIPTVSYLHCKEAGKMCKSFIRVEATTGNRDDGFYPENDHRYYVAENKASSLERVLESQNHNVTVDLKVLPSGLHMLGELCIDNVPWRDWLAQNPKAAEFGMEEE